MAKGREEVHQGPEMSVIKKEPSFSRMNLSIAICKINLCRKTSQTRHDKS